MPAEHVEIARLPRFLHTLLASAKCFDRTKNQRLAFTYGINPRVSALATLSHTLQYLGFTRVQLVSRGQFVTGRQHVERAVALFDPLD